jgi:hypothetical protein
MRRSGSIAVRLLALMMIGLWTVSARADDLPINLILKCEGKVATIMNFARKWDSHDDTFETILRLKDGELSETGTWFTTKGCVLHNGVVRCSAKLVVASKIDSGSTRHELTSYIDRETGEYTLIVESWRFAGANASGQQQGHMTLRRSGFCHEVSNLIFNPIF